MGFQEVELGKNITFACNKQKSSMTKWKGGRMRQKRTKRNGGSQNILGNQNIKGTENTNINAEVVTSANYEVMASSKIDIDDAHASVSSQSRLTSMHTENALSTASHTPHEQHADLSCQDMEMQDIMVSVEKLLQYATRLINKHNVKGI